MKLVFFFLTLLLITNISFAQRGSSGRYYSDSYRESLKKESLKKERKEFVAKVMKGLSDKSNYPQVVENCFERDWKGIEVSQIDRDDLKVEASVLKSSSHRPIWNNLVDSFFYDEKKTYGTEILNILRQKVNEISRMQFLDQKEIVCLMKCVSSHYFNDTNAKIQKKSLKHNMCYRDGNSKIKRDLFYQMAVRNYSLWQRVKLGEGKNSDLIFLNLGEKYFVDPTQSSCELIKF